MSAHLSTATAPALLYDPVAGLHTREISHRPAGPGEVEIDIRAAGVCHSDLHILTGDWPSDRPLVMGHEAAACGHGHG